MATKLRNSTWQTLTAIVALGITLVVGFVSVGQSSGKVLEKLEALDENVAALKTDVATLKTDVATLKTDVAALNVDVETLKVDTAVLKQLHQPQAILDLLLAIEDREVLTQAYVAAAQEPVSTGWDTAQIRENLRIVTSGDVAAAQRALLSAVQMDRSIVVVR